MIKRSLLLDDLQRLLTKLEADLRVRAEEVAEINADLKVQHTSAAAEKRTAAPFKEWREDLITQVGVAWILGCVFVRFLEDNAFLDAPLLSGPGECLAAARDQQTVYVRAYPTDSDREYLLHVFATVGKLPVLSRLYDGHNPLHVFGPSADGAQALLNFWQQADPATGALRHDFTDTAADTRFIGDLYQDLSKSARERFALLQTPVFVEEFILDRTLDPAILTFGLDKVKMIDPTCGSGHFLLGGFQRLLDRWFRQEPGANPIELVRRSLDAIHGIDLNPFAVAIARFRLLIAALRAGGIAKLRSAPNWPLHVFTGDSLLFGPEPGQMVADSLLTAAIHGNYRTEDADDVSRVLSGRYHAVVGNPPYITVEDKVVKASVKQRFKSCHGKWVLVCPFFERFFDLAVHGDDRGHQPSGFVGKITGNNFMKREFGKKLVEEFIPLWDLTHVVDTSYADIPNHTTPTVIIFGRNSSPIAPTIRAVMGIKGEPAPPVDPAQGLVWRAILDQIDLPGTESEFISVADTPREIFHHHPWSIGGGGASELKVRISESGAKTLKSCADSIGITAFTLEDDIFIQSPQVLKRRGLGNDAMRCIVEGDTVRDWFMDENDFVVWPYDSEFKVRLLSNDAPIVRFLWQGRTCLSNNKMFGNKTKIQAGLKWYEFGRLTDSKLRTPLSITFSEVASHNHFVLDRGGKVFKNSAPVIKLPRGATEEEHLRVLGLLNSSTACFWLKQVCQAKGTVSGDISSEKGRSESNRYSFNSKAVENFPIPEFNSVLGDRLVGIARRLDSLGASRNFPQRVSAILHPINPKNATVSELRAALSELAHSFRSERRRMVALQEELDWTVYVIFGLTDAGLLSQAADLEELDPLARTFVNGDLTQNGLPAKRAVEIQKNAAVRLIETPTFKRPWFGRQGVYGSATKSIEEEIEECLRAWLLDRLEERSHRESEGFCLLSISDLAERIRTDADFMRLAELHAGRTDFDLNTLITTFVAVESVPALPGQRYTESGLRKREQWEHTWDQQRQEDAIIARRTAGMTAEAIQNPTVQQAIRSEVNKEMIEILVPPKYASADFQKSSYWRMRGKLDVPKERWVSYPGAERSGDPTLVIAWAGWNHLQQAQALAAHYERLKSDGAADTQLAKVLASLHQLIPWLLQWHNEIDPAYGERLGNFFKSFVEEESRRLQLTADRLSVIANYH